MDADAMYAQAVPFLPSPHRHKKPAVFLTRMSGPLFTPNDWPFMDNVLQYEIPALHPLAVHFPLVLILVGTLAVVIWGIRGKLFWWQTSVFLYVLAMAGALFAYFTGEELEEQMEGDPILEELGGLHEDMGLYTLIVTGVTLVAMMGLMIWRKRSARLGSQDPLIARMIIVVLALLAAGLVAWTAHIGGVMVWGRPVM